MYLPFPQWDYTKASAELRARQKEGDKSSLAYVVDKNNWQEGEGYSGPPFGGGDAQTSTVLKGGIGRVFTPKGTIPSVVRRHRRGVVGREPGWIVSLRRKPEKVLNRETGELEDAKPNPQEQARIEEANELLLDWWNGQRGLRAFRQAVTHYCAVGRGPLRLYWPPALRQEVSDGTRTTLGMPRMSFQEAARKIFLLAPKPDEATVVTDTFSMGKAGVYTFEDEQGRPCLGLCYVREDGKTAIRTLRQSGASQSEQARAQAGRGLLERARDYITGGETGEPEYAYNLNGNLLLFELDGEALITDAVKRQQKLEDKAGTMLSHNMDEAGFREEIFFNTQPPGKMVEVEDPDNPGQMVRAFVKGDPSFYERGPGKRAYMQGTDISEQDPKTLQWRPQLANPDVKVIEPVNVDTYIKTAETAKQNILEECDQLHVLIAGDATSSGVSRQQAREDHKKALDETKSEVDYVGSSVMETFLSLVAIFAGKEGYFDGLRVSFKATVDAGPISADERRVNIEEMKEGVKSEEDARIAAGDTDPESTAKKILAEKRAKIAAGLAPNPAAPPTVEDKTREGLPA
jgi:hypothetical protein